MAGVEQAREIQQRIDEARANNDMKYNREGFNRDRSKCEYH